MILLYREVQFFFRDMWNIMSVLVAMFYVIAGPIIVYHWRTKAEAEAKETAHAFFVVTLALAALYGTFDGLAHIFMFFCRLFKW